MYNVWGINKVLLRISIWFRATLLDISRRESSSNTFATTAQMYEVF